jgi:hypothetical protein
MEFWPQDPKLDLKVLNHETVVIQDNKLLWDGN